MYISHLVLVIPLMAKADSMTQRETIAYRASLLRMLQGIPSFDLKEVTKVFKTIPPERFPYSVIGAEFDGSGNEIRRKRDNMRIRSYLWGEAEVDNKDHCDIFYLRQSIMQSSDFHAIKRLTSRRWERFIEQDGIIQSFFVSLRRAFCIC